MKKALVMTLVVALLLCVTAFAATGAATTIQALLDPTISIKYDGEVRNMYDANGQQVYPIAYNGTTYVPVRAISGLYGVPVDWDNETRTVVLGSKADDILPLSKAESSKTTAHCYWGSKLPGTVTVGGTNFDFKESDLVWEIWCGFASDQKHLRVNFDTKGYSTLTFDAVSDADATLFVYNADNESVTTVKLSAGEIKRDITVDIAGSGTIAFGANGTKTIEEGAVHIIDANFHN